MGMSLANHLVYGIKIGCPDEDEVLWLGDKDYYDLNEELSDDVEIHSSHSHDFAHLTLIATLSEKREYYLSPINVLEHINQFNEAKLKEWDKALEEACKQLGMAYEQPRWQAIAQYF